VAFLGVDPSCVWNSDKDAVAIEALMRLPSSGKEQAGALFKNEKGEWCYSTPVTGKNDSFEFKIKNAPGAKFDGLYHTHPVDAKEKVNALFSAGDVATADQLKKESYIRALLDDSIKKYTPGVSNVEFTPHDLTQGNKTSKGTDITPNKKLAAVIRGTP
jgi:hypothetical protein